VGIGLLALVVLPVPFLRSVGVAAMLIPLVSVAVALTLLPVALVTVGQLLEWPRIRRETHANRRWLAWGRAGVSHRLLAAGGGLAAPAALIVAASSIQFGIPEANSLAKHGQARAGLVALERAGIGTGSLVPIEALTPAARAHAVAAHLDKVRGVRTAIAPTE